MWGEREEGDGGEGERGRGSGDPCGPALAALPGPADLKEFVFLLFFQKEL